MIHHHGLRQVFSEGLTRADLPGFKRRIEALRQVEKQQPTLRQQKDEVNEILSGLEAAGKKDSERYHEACTVAREIDALLSEHRLALLELGVPGRLLVAGEGQRW